MAKKKQNKDEETDLNEDNLIKKFTNGISAKEIGVHLSTFVNLYLHPLKSWKQCVNYQKSSYQFVILHLIYYTIFLFFIIQDETLAIPLALLEAIATIIPTSIFTIPFLIFRKFEKKKMNWNRLFRLFLVVKFQIIPLILLIHLLAKYTRLEELYILIDNLFWLILLIFILLMPIVMRIKVWQKLLYILFNYIFLQIFIVLILFILSLFETESFNSESEMSEYFSITPSNEFLDFKTTGGYSTHFINPKHFYIRAKQFEHQHFSIEGTQFGTISLDLAFTIKSANDIKRKLLYHDSLLVLLDSTHISKSHEYKLHPIQKELSVNKLDSLKNDFDSRIEKDLLLSSTLKDSSLFNSNRKYFENLYKYLTEYKKPFENLEIRNDVFRNDSLNSFVILEDSTWIFQYLIDSTRYSSEFYKSHKKLDVLELKFKKRERWSSFAMEILLFPINRITDYFLENE